MKEGNTRPLARRMLASALPLLEFLGRTAGFSPDALRLSFIRRNNALILSGAKKYDPAEMLILLPHCLQRSGCALRLIREAGNCRRCGLCPIGALLEIAEHHGVQLAVAPGGTVARRIIQEKKPRFILAVACERDLASGIKDSYPLPVFGLLNERPGGPCFDTLIDPKKLEEAVMLFKKEGEALPPQTPSPGRCPGPARGMMPLDPR